MNSIPYRNYSCQSFYEARAIENQCYILAAAQVGHHNEKRQSYGHSVGKSICIHLLHNLFMYAHFYKSLNCLAYELWGELLADAGGYDGEGLPDTTINSYASSAQSNEKSPVHVPSIIIADIDLDKLESVRERMPIQQHRDSSYNKSW